MSDNSLWVFYDSLAKIQSNPLSKDEAQSTILKIRPQTIDRYFIWTQGWQNWQKLKDYLESDQKNFVSTFTISRTNEETIAVFNKELKDNTVTKSTRTTAPPPEDTITRTETSSYSQVMLAEETISRYIQAELVKDIYAKKFDADDLTFSNIQKPGVSFSDLSKKMDDRAARHDLKIEVLLISKRGKTFRTRSKNISLTGCLIEDTMPFEFYDNLFDIVVLSTITKDPKKARVKLQARAVATGGTRSQRLKFENPSEETKNSLKELLEEYMRLRQEMKDKPKAS